MLALASASINSFLTSAVSIISILPSFSGTYLSAFSYFVSFEVSITLSFTSSFFSVSEAALAAAFSLLSRISLIILGVATPLRAFVH